MVDSPAHSKKLSINEALLFRILNKIKEKKCQKTGQKSFPPENCAVCNDIRLLEHDMLRLG